ncbi:hypothetical protein EDB87DRAFT_1582476 [Lactarius vividus]|nr:hypothetical protein EDB87DRAFT_1582476 [Lactarius vividus]
MGGRSRKVTPVHRRWLKWRQCTWRCVQDSLEGLSHILYKYSRAYPFPQEGSEDFRGPALNFCSIYWTNPLFVDVKAWCYRATFHNPPPLSPSEDHDASPLLPSLQSCILATLLVVNPDPNATGVVGAGKRKAGQGRSGKPVSLSRRGGIFYSLSVLRTIMPTVVAELQWGHNVNACTLHAIFTHAFAYQIIPLFLLLSHLNVAYRRVGQVNNERKQGAREQDTEVGSSGEASD